MRRPVPSPNGFQRFKAVKAGRRKAFAVQGESPKGRPQEFVARQRRQQGAKEIRGCFGSAVGWQFVGEMDRLGLKDYNGLRNQLSDMLRILKVMMPTTCTVRTWLVAKLASRCMMMYASKQLQVRGTSHT